MRVALIGTGGNLGQRTLRQLATAGYTVRAISRNPTEMQSLAAESGVTDLAQADLAQADTTMLTHILSGCQALISTLGVRPPLSPADLTAVEEEGVKKLVDAARAAGIEHFILTSSIGAEHPDELPYIADILKAKRQAELYLIDSGLPYTIVRPGGLTDARGGERVKVGRGDKMQMRGQISREDVATVLIEALRQDAARGQTIEIINRADGKMPSELDFFAQG